MSFIPPNKVEYICPAVTLFDENGKVDYESNFKHYDHLIEGGVSGIAIIGSAGEFFNLNLNDVLSLVEKGIQHINKRVKVVIGAGRMLAEETIAICNLAYEKGANSVLLVTPFYNALTQKEAEDYYHHIASNTKISIILYNFPAKSGTALDPETILAIRRANPTVIGIKDTVAGFDHTRAVIQTVHKEFPDFQVYSGYDENFSHNAISGGVGCIAALSNLFPRVTSGLVNAWNSGDLANVIKNQQKIDELMSFYNLAPQFISAMKTALVQLGIAKCDRMIIHASTTPAEKEKVLAYIKANGLL